MNPAENDHVKIDKISINKRVTLFIGKNGSGKSTLLKAVSNLISYEGEIITSKSISYMPENPIFPKEITVKEFLFNLYQLEPNDYDYNDLIVKFGLKDKIHEKINALSKGMQAKLNLIQSLMVDKDLYLLDEPLSGLDETSTKILVDYIKNSKKNFIISSHLEETFLGLECEVIYFDQFA